MVEALRERVPAARRWLLPGIAGAILLAATLMRLPMLDARSFHGDEAENWLRAITLFEGAGYRYDPSEYHGPTLAYLTLPALLLAGGRAGDTEASYRRVTAGFGIALVVLTLAAAPAIGPAAALWAAGLAAISVSLCFYSRYYIHEIVFVCFSWAAILAGAGGVRATRARAGLGRRVCWAIACGASLGSMHATKETAVLAWFAMGVAALATVGRARDGGGVRRPWSAPALAAGLLAAVGVSALLFSSFFTNARGPLDSVLTYLSYFGRGTGGAPEHVHPWYWYLALLAWARPDLRGPGFGEGLVLVLATLGCVAACSGRGVDARHRPFARFMAVYSLVLFGVYSALPYKTPWSILGAFQGLTVVAGVGAVALWRWLPRRGARVVVGVLLAFGVAQLTAESWRASFVLHSDRRNPHVYGHPLAGLREVVARTRALAALHEDGLATRVMVVTGGNVWPLPFYLRQLPHAEFHFGDPPEQLDAPILIVDNELIDRQRWGGLPGYAGPRFFALRPGFDLGMYVRRPLWEAYRRADVGDP